MRNDYNLEINFNMDLIINGEKYKAIEQVERLQYLIEDIHFFKVGDIIDNYFDKYYIYHWHVSSNPRYTMIRVLNIDKLETINKIYKEIQNVKIKKK